MPKMHVPEPIFPEVKLVTMKSFVFWNIPPCSQRHFARTCCLCLQGWFLASFDHDDEGDRLLWFSTEYAALYPRNVTFQGREKATKEWKYIAHVIQERKTKRHISYMQENCVTGIHNKYVYTIPALSICNYYGDSSLTPDGIETINALDMWGIQHFKEFPNVVTCIKILIYLLHKLGNKGFLNNKDQTVNIG
jgi:hypothetical protein